MSTKVDVFLGKEVREISRFFVATPRAFPLSVWHGFTDFLTHKYLHLSTRVLLMEFCVVLIE